MAKTKKSQKELEKLQKRMASALQELHVVAYYDDHCLYRVMSAVLQTGAHLASLVNVPENLFVKNTKAYYRQEKAIRLASQTKSNAVIEELKNATETKTEVTKRSKPRTKRRYIRR